MLNFLDTHTILVIFHLLGVAVGAGGAYMSDVIFFTAAKDGRITDTEMKFLKAGSKVVWFGLFLLIFSGLGLFLDHLDRYLGSSKFIAKMIIVGIIFLNGIFFHIIHLPRLNKIAKLSVSLGDEFKKKFSTLVVSGVVSLVSWTFAIILGSLRGIPFSVLTILGFYLLVLIIGFLVSIPIKNKLSK